MPWWAYLLASIWYIGWWVAILGWWMAYFQGEFPELHYYDYFTADELHAIGVHTPEETYRRDLWVGVFFATFAALVPFVLPFTGIWKHGWGIKPRRDK